MGAQSRVPDPVTRCSIRQGLLPGPLGALGQEEKEATGEGCLGWKGLHEKRTSEPQAATLPLFHFAGVQCDLRYRRENVNAHICNLPAAFVVPIQAGSGRQEGRGPELAVLLYSRKVRAGLQGGESTRVWPLGINVGRKINEMIGSHRHQVSR